MNNTEDRYSEILEGTPEFLQNYLRMIINKTKRSRKSASEKLKKDIIKKVEAAIKDLYDNDLQLIEDNMNEVTITGRLSLYLNNQFKDYKGYFVDIEYYRYRIPKEESYDLRKNRIRCERDVCGISITITLKLNLFLI